MKKEVPLTAVPSYIIFKGGYGRVLKNDDVVLKEVLTKDEEKEMEGGGQSPWLQNVERSLYDCCKWVQGRRIRLKLRRWWLGMRGQRKELRCRLLVPRGV